MAREGLGRVKLPLAFLVGFLKKGDRSEDDPLGNESTGLLYPISILLLPPIGVLVFNLRVLWKAWFLYYWYEVEVRPSSSLKSSYFDVLNLWSSDFVPHSALLSSILFRSRSLCSSLWKATLGSFSSHQWVSFLHRITLVPKERNVREARRVRLG